ncbi:MAG TPA: transglycosylase SLT domain-containing protein [Steroidobacteraceae bacterium]|nr:transglycosylase SLT domain-containing protein [Steroidobacteraceae bacterium]
MLEIRWKSFGWAATLALLIAAFIGASRVRADMADPFTYPAQLEPDVRFWIRVYTEVTTEQGLLHDDWYLGLVYEVLRFDASDSPRRRERTVEQAKARYAALLRRFAAGDTADLTPHEHRILDAFGEKATPAEFRAAIDRIRFQLGQADRFHEGLIRAQTYESGISRVLAERGVPPQIGALPHVESSFNPAAYSRVGAAGLWQFMPGTARRYMRVDGVVDQRLDPYSATEAAADLMLYNYRLLGSWPLAVTAYNHGPGGLRRAQDELGTSNIEVIVKRFQGATFGFASRNFYVAFLAALEVDRNAESFFGPLTHPPEAPSVVVALPDYAPIDALAKAFKADLGALRVLNPALRPPVWNRTRFVPRGYALRIPGSPQPAEIAAAWARLQPADRYAVQRNDGAHRARRGETLAGIAAASGVTLNRLLAANGWNAPRDLARGQIVRIPMPASRAEGSEPIATAAIVPAPAEAPAVAEPPVARSSPVASAPRAATAPAGAPAVARLPPQKEPVSERETESAALLPAASPSGNGDTTDYSVGANNTVVVQADETLGHFADWSKVSSASLRALNKLHKSAMVTLGHKVKLDLSRVGAEQFEAARREYHQKLQETFFAAHRISGTENYVVKKGESLWIIAQQHADLPVWLVAEYNPDVDFADVRPGTTVALPRVEAINRQ